MSDAPKKSSERTLPKRFYKTAAAEPASDGSYRILLDGRPVRTPAKADLTLPTRALADAVAAEWDAQGTTIDPATMPLTRLANTTVDGVAPRRAEVAQEIARYAASDLVCYRAEHPQALVDRQAAAWDHVVAWAGRRLGVAPRVGSGVVHVPQPPALPAQVENHIAGVSPIELAALHLLTTLTGSALLALAHADHLIDADAAWAAANIDEDFQAEQWGWDAEAQTRRKLRHLDFIAASRALSLAA